MIWLTVYYRDETEQKGRMVLSGTISMLARVTGLLALCSLAAAQAQAGTAQRSAFGTLADGTPIEAVTLSNAHGVSVRIITYGATIQSLLAPDRHGTSADVVLGYDELGSYVDKPNYFGATIGRFANRIAGARFSLDGREYHLSSNDQANSLHGGARGFDKRVWKILTLQEGPTPSVSLQLSSAAGDQGYPGTLVATTTYALDDTGALGIDYTATTDAPTVVSLTNHSYFNLAGEGAADGLQGQRLSIPASHYTPVDSTLIPTGELRGVAGTVFDFTHPREINAGIRDGRDAQIVAGRGYDHNFVLDAGLTLAPKLAARLEDPRSGRVLEVWTTAPGLQVYTGNHLVGTLVGKRGHLYRMGDGIALEPQMFPNAPNNPHFASARLDRGSTYHHRLIYRIFTGP